MTHLVLVTLKHAIVHRVHMEAYRRALMRQANVSGVTWVVSDEYRDAAVASDRVVVDLPRGLPAVSADATLLERVIWNLVSNALRYSPAQAPVDVTATVAEHVVVLAIADRGPGIATAASAAVFTPFHRVGTQADGGTGLGLAIVRGFTEAMGMHVHLRERDGGGLVASVEMPAMVSP